jgi:broad specificity phosphatase PhoE
MRLLLIRHGQTPSNLLHSLDTAEPGPGLTALGERQSIALVGELASEPIEAVYASALTRARLTAAPLAAAFGLDVRVRFGIREIPAGALEGRSDPEASAIYRETIFGWASGDRGRLIPGSARTGGEMLEEFDSVVAEAEAAVDHAAAAAVVSHAGAIRVWVASRCGNVSVEYASTHALLNAGVVVVEGSAASGWSASQWLSARDTPPAADTRPAAGQGAANAVKAAWQS